jgi:hypothetical protein
MLRPVEHAIGDYLVAVGDQIPPPLRMDIAAE